MACAALVAPAAVAARPAAPVAGVSRSAFYSGARLAPRATSGALLSARARAPAVIEARAAKGSATGQQITVDVEKPLGLVGGGWGRGWAGFELPHACRQRERQHVSGAAPLLLGAMHGAHMAPMHVFCVAPCCRCWTRAAAPRAA